MSDDDLFKLAMNDVRPLKAGNRAKLLPTAPNARPRSLEADNAAVMAELLLMDQDIDEGIEAGDELSYRSDCIQDSVYRKLRRGAFAVGAELDLHGLRVADARTAVRDFLVSCRAQDIRCVRIIHGKGKGSDRGPVLKQSVDAWLRRRSEVLAFCSARSRHGGTGALYVLLRALR